MNRLLLPAPATKQEPLTEETAPDLDMETSCQDTDTPSTPASVLPRAA